jgi:hypothetical protein
MPESRKRPCSICRHWFRPHPRVGARQHACSNPECQSARRRQTQADWRAHNPEYAAGYRIQYPDIKIVILTMHPDIGYATAALALGHSGYVLAAITEITRPPKARRLLRSCALRAKLAVPLRQAPERPSRSAPMWRVPACPCRLPGTLSMPAASSLYTTYSEKGSDLQLTWLDAGRLWLADYAGACAAWQGSRASAPTPWPNLRWYSAPNNL